MDDELIRMTAREAVRRLEAGEITPLDLIEAVERRIAACEPALNALPRFASIAPGIMRAA